MRRVLGDTLSRLGLGEACVADLLLAVTEACTNVLRHAGPGHRYEVVVQVGKSRCVLQVLDTGRGFDPARVRSARGPHLRGPHLRGPHLRGRQLRRPPVRPVPLLRRRVRDTDVAQLAESGRGLAIMRACVDDVSLHTGPGLGTVVELRKRIEWRNDAPLTDRGGWALRDAG